MPSASLEIGTRISTSSSSVASWLVMKPVKKSARGMTRSPPGPARITLASRASRATATSPPGGGVNRLPPTVPMLRIDQLAVFRAASRSSRDVVLPQQLGQRRGGADPQRPVRALEPVQAGPAQAHHRLGQRDALVDERHGDGPAGHHQQLRAVLLQQAQRLGQRSRQEVVPDRHAGVSLVGCLRSLAIPADGSPCRRESRLRRPWLTSDPARPSTKRASSRASGPPITACPS